MSLEQEPDINKSQQLEAQRIWRNGDSVRVIGMA